MSEKLDIDLVFSDIDGTLLDEGQQKVSELNKEAISAVKKEGKTFILATGRGYAWTMNVALQLNPSYLICSNGGLIYSLLENKVLGSCPIDSDFCQRLLRKLYLRTDVFAFLHCVNEDGELKNFYIGKPNKEFYKLHISLKYFVPLPDPKILKSWQVVRISLFGPGHTLDVFYTFLELSKKISIYFDPNKTFMEINDINASKGIAASFLMQLLKTDPGKAMAFGNGTNDISLFWVVKYGIAVANAVPQLKKLAFAITESCADSGVGRALHKWILPKKD